jgi:hypothetical protein
MWLVVMVIYQMIKNVIVTKETAAEFSCLFLAGKSCLELATLSVYCQLTVSLRVI